MACRLCGLNHPGWVNCKVAAASNIKQTASNSASNTVVNASNRTSVASNAKANGETPLDQPLIPVATKVAGVDSGERPATHQRWAKEKYNAYQRFYMQTMRAVKAGRAELIRTV